MTEQTIPAIPPGYMKDSKGRLVPESMVKPEDLLEDQMVKLLIGFAEDLSAQIARFRGHCFDDVGSFLDVLAEKYGAKRGGERGNMTFSTYDGLCKVQIQVSDSISFGAGLQVAKGLIDECLAEWTEGSRAELKAVIDGAFQTDKEGLVNREAVFRLRRLPIEDARWQSAMQAITDSIRVEGSKAYIRFYQRARPTDKWSAITIDLAAA